MSVKILETKDGEALFFESATDWVFGPLMKDFDEAHDFWLWLKERDIDPRQVDDGKLESLYTDFRNNI